jgi:hypothetical protein
MEHASISKKTGGKTIPSTSTKAGSMTSSPAAPSPVDYIMEFHQAIGNQAVQRMLESGTLQLEDTNIQPGDIYSQEVDRLVQRVESRFPSPEQHLSGSNDSNAHLSMDRPSPPRRQKSVQMNRSRTGHSGQTVIQRDDSLEEEGEKGHAEDMEEKDTDTTQQWEGASDQQILEEMERIGATAAQLARTGNAWSGPKGPGLPANDITYYRDGGGNIDFSNPYKDKDFSSPHNVGNSFIGPYKVDLKQVDSTKNRTEHFLKANKMVNAKFGAGYENKGVSPPNYTWHHLSKAYEMVLIDRTAHKRFGHNGGVHIW